MLSVYKTNDELKVLAEAMQLDISSITYIEEVCSNARDNIRIPDKVDQGEYLYIDSCRLTDAELESAIRILLEDKITYEIAVRRERRKLEKLIHGDTGCKSWFVTIGLDDKQFDDNNEAGIINILVKKIKDTPGFENVNFVVEKYRRAEDNSIYIHRHIHLVFDSQLRKSKIIQFCFQKAKRYLANQSFVDVKPDPNRSRMDYIRGNKPSMKLECVDKDRSWRKEKKIVEDENL